MLKQFFACWLLQKKNITRYVKIIRGIESWVIQLYYDILLSMNSKDLNEVLKILRWIWAWSKVYFQWRQKEFHIDDTFKHFFGRVLWIQLWIEVLFKLIEVKSRASLSILHGVLKETVNNKPIFHLQEGAKTSKVHLC